MAVELETAATVADLHHQGKLTRGRSQLQPDQCSLRNRWQPELGLRTRPHKGLPVIQVLEGPPSAHRQGRIVDHRGGQKTVLGERFQLLGDPAVGHLGSGERRPVEVRVDRGNHPRTVHAQPGLGRPRGENHGRSGLALPLEARPPIGRENMDLGLDHHRPFARGRSTGGVHRGLPGAKGLMVLLTHQRQRRPRGVGGHSKETDHGDRRRNEGTSPGKKRRRRNLDPHRVTGVGAVLEHDELGRGQAEDRDPGHGRLGSDPPPPDDQTENRQAEQENRRRQPTDTFDEADIGENLGVAVEPVNVEAAVGDKGLDKSGPTALEADHHRHRHH